MSLSLVPFHVALLANFATAAAIESISRIERSGRAWDFPMPLALRRFFSRGCILQIARIAAHLVTLIRGRNLPEPERAAIE